MTKAELVKKIADSEKLTVAVSGRIVDLIRDTIIGEVAKGGEIALPGLGKFSAVKRAAREGRNPQTGKAIKIPAKKAPKFTAGKDFKERVAKGK